MTNPRTKQLGRALGVLLIGGLCVAAGVAQDGRRAAPHVRQMLEAEFRTQVRQHHSRIIVAERNISRIAVTAPEVANFVQYSPNEVAIVGIRPGSTDLTLWFENDTKPVMYEVHVTTGNVRQPNQKVTVDVVAAQLAKVFPRSKVQLVPVGDQLVVRGQVWDAAEAKHIMQIVTAQFGVNGRKVVNMLRVPGEFQVLLRVRIAELDRTQLRRLGVSPSELLKRGRSVAAFGPTSAGVSGVFDDQQMSRLFKWLCSNGTVTYLAEPSLTVLSGHAASFLSGGEFAVKGGADDAGRFHRYGTSLEVTPTVLDRDLIRLKVAPEFSQIDEHVTVNGVPGTNVRRVQTVVELREGQTIALGGLVARQMRANATKHMGRRLFSRRKVTEGETELLVVVTPEIVRPMDPGEVPPLPGFDVLTPNDDEFFRQGRTESCAVEPEFGTVVTNASPRMLPPVGPDRSADAGRPTSVIAPPGSHSASGYLPDNGPGQDAQPLFDLPTGPAPASTPPPKQSRDEGQWSIPPANYLKSQPPGAEAKRATPAPRSAATRSGKERSMTSWAPQKRSAVREKPRQRVGSGTVAPPVPKVRPGTIETAKKVPAPGIDAKLNVRPVTVRRPAAERPPWMGHTLPKPAQTSSSNQPPSKPQKAATTPEPAAASRTSAAQPMPGFLGHSVPREAR